MLRSGLVQLLSAVLLLALAVTANAHTSSDLRQERKVPSTVDFIVLGLGTSGSVVASRLASAKKSSGKFAYDVLGIDVGRDLTGSDLTSVTSNWATIKGSEADFDCQIAYGEPRVKLSNMDKLHITQGRTLGGCSAINSAMWVRGSPEDYNGWGAQNPGWSFADVLPYFKSLENNTNKYAQNPGYHGNSGPLSITGNVMTPRIQPFIDAAESLGMSFNPDINGANIITSALGSVGRIDVTAVNGVRQNAYQSFLRPLVLAGQDNLFVRDQSYVLRINFKDKVAKSVDWIDLKTNEVQTTKARKEIILSLGALHSAQILMLSGVGDASELAAAGVQELVHHLPGVGKNLQDHPIATMSVMSTNLPACGTSPGGDPRVDLFFRTGLRGETDGRPDVEVIGGNSCGYSFALVYLMTPKSRGEVKLVNSDPTSRPKVVMNYFTDPENYDLRALAEGMRLTQKFYQAAPLNGFTLEKWPAGGAPLNYSDYNVVSDYILGTTTGTANSNSGMHMAGTLKMGPASDPMAVVDHRLRVRGIDKLRVLDNSIQPEITCGNIQAPAYLIGEKGAAMILQDN